MTRMDVREKLVEIVKKAAYSSLPSNTEDFHLNMFVANLLAHGVTVQEWISVKDMLPDDWVDVLACLQCGDCVVAVKSGPIWRERFTNIRLEDRDITHWMPLPQPPKEE